MCAVTWESWEAWLGSIFSPFLRPIYNISHNGSCPFLRHSLFQTRPLMLGFPPTSLTAPSPAPLFSPTSACWRTAGCGPGASSLCCLHSQERSSGPGFKPAPQLLVTPSAKPRLRTPAGLPGPPMHHLVEALLAPQSHPRNTYLLISSPTRLPLIQGRHFSQWQPQAPGGPHPSMESRLAPLFLSRPTFDPSALPPKHSFSLRAFHLVPCWVLVGVINAASPWSLCFTLASHELWSARWPEGFCEHLGQVMSPLLNYVFKVNTN